MARLQYDRVFRREAAANNTRDWSVMRPDLYNYHTAFVNRNPPQEHRFREPRGSSTSRTCCYSWNSGRAPAAGTPANIVTFAPSQIAKAITGVSNTSVFPQEIPLAISAGNDAWN
jgi:hypothetical protein